MSGNGICCLLGGAPSGWLGGTAKRGRVRIEAEADLTATLRYERRKPVGKGPDRGQGTSPP